LYFLIKEISNKLYFNFYSVITPEKHLKTNNIT